MPIDNAETVDKIGGILESDLGYGRGDDAFDRRDIEMRLIIGVRRRHQPTASQ